LGRKSDNCWVKTDWLDAGEGAENPNWYRYENFDKAYEIALSEESNKTTPWVTEWKQSKDKTETDEWVSNNNKGRMAFIILIPKSLWVEF
jgi:hypothetical protein